MKLIIILTSLFSIQAYSKTLTKEEVKFCKEVASTKKRIECVNHRIEMCLFHDYIVKNTDHGPECRVRGTGKGIINTETFKSVVTEYGKASIACKKAEKIAKKEAKELCKNKYKNCSLLVSGISEFPKNNQCEYTVIYKGNKKFLM